MPRGLFLKFFKKKKIFFRRRGHDRLCSAGQVASSRVLGASREGGRRGGPPGPGGPRSVCRRGRAGRRAVVAAAGAGPAVGGARPPRAAAIRAKRRPPTRSSRRSKTRPPASGPAAEAWPTSIVSGGPQALLFGRSPHDRPPLADRGMQVARCSSPAKTKYRKQQRGRRGRPLEGTAAREFRRLRPQGSRMRPGHEPSDRSRPIAMTCKIAPQQGVDQRISDKPVSQKPAETRMGSGRGAPEHRVAVVKPGESCSSSPASEPLAKEAMRLAGGEAADQDEVREAGGVILESERLRELSDDESASGSPSSERSCSTCASRMRRGRSRTRRACKHTKREIARILTVQDERELGTGEYEYV